MRAAVVEPLQNIAGTGSKVWSMILAELLLGADPQRERWVTTGASMIAIAVFFIAPAYFAALVARTRTAMLASARADAPP